MLLVVSLILTHFDELNLLKSRLCISSSCSEEERSPFMALFVGTRTLDENTALVVLFIEGNFGENWSHTAEDEVSLLFLW